jgi:hypothetical protein
MYRLWSASKTVEIKKRYFTNDREERLACKSSLDRKAKYPKIV